MYQENNIDVKTILITILVFAVLISIPIISLVVLFYEPSHNRPEIIAEAVDSVNEGFNNILKLQSKNYRGQYNYDFYLNKKI